MSAGLKISIGQYSDKGRKPANQDFYGALIPEQSMLDLKGMAIAVADGISSSEVSSIAAQTAIKSFLSDYYATPDSWPVKTSARRVIAATNSWLHAQTRGSPYPFDADKGYVCTLSVLVLKSRAAHIFHIGDSRIYRLSDRSLEQLTVDHRVAAAPGQYYLGRALGIGPNVEIDYRSIPVAPGDVFILATDGVHEHIDGESVAQAISSFANDLDVAARQIAEQAFERGSDDNLTIQIARVDALPEGEPEDFFGQAANLPMPPPLEPGMVFDGYRIVRQLHGNSRSSVYLAQDNPSDQLVAIKVPGSDVYEDAAHLQRFMLEEWIAQRISSPHVLKNHSDTRRRSALYVATEYLEGSTLTQWMIDNPQPDLTVFRDIIEQIARGLQAFHRLEMLHQDLRPDNIMIDKTGTVKIIDFGSTKVAGVVEAQPMREGAELLGTVQFMAPEYLLGETGTERSDIFSLGVIAYQMLTGKLPFGPSAARLRSQADLAKLRYAPIPGVPIWLDQAIEKSVSPLPDARYDVLSEFTFDLRHPNAAFAELTRRPLFARNPVVFWQITSLALAVTAITLFAMLVS